MILYILAYVLCVLVWGYCYYVGCVIVTDAGYLFVYIINKIGQKRLFNISDFGVLVGAFSDFGMFDTGKPVQILPHFRKSAPILKLLGLI